jgi:hypothetical protein
MRELEADMSGRMSKSLKGIEPFNLYIKLLTIPLYLYTKLLTYYTKLLTKPLNLCTKQLT